MAARARDVMYETFFYKKDDGSISKAFSEVGNSFWNKTVTKDFQEYTETYALPEMEKLQGKEELKKTFRKLHECINKYRGDKEEDIGCPTEYKDRLKTVAESSDKLWISDNLSAMQSWVPTMKCSTDWMQSPYIRMYEDSATGLCSDDKVELSPNPFLFSVSELI